MRKSNSVELQSRLTDIDEASRLILKIPSTLALFEWQEGARQKFQYLDGSPRKRVESHAGDKTMNL